MYICYYRTYIKSLLTKPAYDLDVGNYDTAYLFKMGCNESVWIVSGTINPDD